MPRTNCLAARSPQIKADNYVQLREEPKSKYFRVHELRRSIIGVTSTQIILILLCAKWLISRLQHQQQSKPEERERQSDERRIKYLTITWATHSTVFPNYGEPLPELRLSLTWFLASNVRLIRKPKELPSTSQTLPLER